MIKRTLYFGNPAYLGKKDSQLVVRLPEVEKNETLPEKFKKESVAIIPIEDIGVVIIDHQQITITQGVLSSLLENNVAVIVCNDKHHPEGLMLPLDVNHIQHERFKSQIESSVPLKKQLWQQTVEYKVRNQAGLLHKVGRDPDRLLIMAGNITTDQKDELLNAIGEDGHLDETLVKKIRSHLGSANAIVNEALKSSRV